MGEIRVYKLWDDFDQCINCTFEHHCVLHMQVSNLNVYSKLEMNNNRNIQLKN